MSNVSFSRLSAIPAVLAPDMAYNFSGNIRAYRFGGAYDSAVRTVSQCMSAQVAANYSSPLTSVRFATGHTTTALGQ